MGGGGAGGAGAAGEFGASGGAGGTGGGGGGPNTRDDAYARTMMLGHCNDVLPAPNVYSCYGDGGGGGNHNGVNGICIITIKANTAASFNFLDQTAVGKNKAITSNTVTLAGPFYNQTATRGGNATAIKINAGSFVAGPVTGVNTGDTVTIQQTSSGTAGTTTKAWGTIGSDGARSGDWSVTP